MISGSQKQIYTDSLLSSISNANCDFFVFFSTEDDNVNVLYKRRDGNYGLLQPDVQDDDA